MARSRIDPQDRAIKVLAGLLKSHQGLVSVVRQKLPHMLVNLRAADYAVAAAGVLLNELRLGEVKMTRWAMTTTLWCVECGHNWEGDPAADEECPECGWSCQDA